jgi:hydrogenase small subunit
VQAAKPNPTQAVPINKVIFDKPIIKVPGCPPIAEVMTGVVTYVLTFGRLPDMDQQGRPKMFYSQRVHDKCYRRPHFDAGQFVESFDDDAARKGYCLYKVGCKGPVTYNACSATRWNEGVSFPIQSGHGCIGCSEEDFWDKGSFYNHLTTIRPPGLANLGIEGTATQFGVGALGVAGAGIAAHAALSALKQARSSSRNDKVTDERLNEPVEK